MTDIVLYNTLSRRLEKFAPLKTGAVSMYQCGPTVYDTPHIGNYRTYIMDDIIRRVFEYNDYAVTQVMNITDVDDKTIRGSREQGLTLKQLTRKYEGLFMDGLDSLNVLRPQHIMRATEYISTMIDLVQNLLDKGAAYAASDGIYMSIAQMPGYGDLAQLKPTLETRERIANDEYDKENPRDFAIWKFRNDNDGDVSWDAPFGAGRPGWHIECSAMSMKILGPTIDIHTGAMDLIFPHHTNEIAQSQASTGQQFVRYWIHGGLMSMNDEKMAKSKKNFVKLEDLIANSVSPLAFRYWLLTAHYRSPLNFTFEAIRGAQNALIRLIKIVGSYPTGGNPIPQYIEQFKAFIDQDLDIPKAVALMWNLIKDTTQNDADKHATLMDFDRVFGLKLASVPKLEQEDIPDEIKALADAREDARQAKDWQKADALRSEIESRGFTVDDTSDGFVIRTS